jgi:cell division protein FtsX
MIYAFLMLVQSGALKFKPLLYGAVVNWLGALAIFINTEFKYDMLISAAAVFIGYIIPGLILRSQYKKERSASKTGTHV